MPTVNVRELLESARRKAVAAYRKLRSDPEFANAHESHAAYRALESVEPWLTERGFQSFGVEGFSEHGGVTYLNTGDGYDLTLLWTNGRFRVAAWADLVEGD